MTQFPGDKLMLEQTSRRVERSRRATEFTFCNSISVVEISRDMFYKGCPKENCLQEVDSSLPNLWRCRKCKKNVESFTVRYCLKFEVTDGSDTRWVTASDSVSASRPFNFQKFAKQGWHCWRLLGRRVLIWDARHIYVHHGPSDLKLKAIMSKMHQIQYLCQVNPLEVTCVRHSIIISPVFSFGNHSQKAYDL